ncbi:hypothetical protein JK636_13710 [Clostridium sp. YIM B02515]|uniref:Flagellar hook-length control protein FliK n=1 Tax=Clostridium rhizosphaerae TaxID=2803861 RepID=A0ABS1TBR8_9CLOT|nr:hypothetical protein [Clostridium rhizosphaerae]
MEYEGGGSVAGINSIIGAYNINPKRVSSKLSFEIGQVFTARVAAISEQNKELILKLLDGWQFPAKLQRPLDFVPDGLVRFQVKGFKDGKLQIKLVNLKDENEDINKDTLEDLLLESNIDISKEDYDTLKKMIKHNMPLTRENISKVKTIIDFKNKILSDSSEEDKFILKYTSNKNIDINSEKGKNVQNILKGFFDELKNLSEDDIFTMLENNIDINEDNIKSFKKLVNENSVVYKEVKNIAQKASGLEVTKKMAVSDNETVKENTFLAESNDKKIIEQKDKVYSILKVLEADMEEGNLSSENIKLYEDLKKIMSDDVDKKQNTDTKEVPIKKPEGDSTAAEDDVNNIKIQDNEIKHTEIKHKNNVNSNRSEIEAEVKQQLSDKTEEIKTIIKNLLKEDMEADSETFSKVFASIKENINDFKVFNSLSNQYYYMDIPINLRKEEYPCRLIIKDDRKSGKKIDSKNVSLVVSVKTVNIGTVDAYVKVRERSMNIDIKCEESSIKLLDSGKNIILNELRELGYNAFIDVTEKQAEVNLSNCSDFFDDSGINSINIRV